MPKKDKDLQNTVTNFFLPLSILSELTNGIGWILTEKRIRQNL